MPSGSAGMDQATAEDVVFSYNRIKEGGGQYQREFELIDSVTALDERSVEIKLISPDANFLHQVANYHQGSIINQRAIDEMGDDVWTQPVGTGPFVLSDLRPGQGFKLDRFDDYFRGAATLEQIDMRIIDDPEHGGDRPVQRRVGRSDGHPPGAAARHARRQRRSRPHRGRGGLHQPLDLQHRHSRACGSARAPGLCLRGRSPAVDRSDRAAHRRPR
ncbi:MAG: ABC transporter substrate-binding protein [Dehalococcoidia bacterium]|nr:ABC transporter substrate-binding protein [Dehalococcoidia bacterium]